MSSLKKPFDLQILERGDFLGRGGFGEVFKVRNKNNDEIYAAKISNQLITESSSDEILSTIREVNIMSKFHHPSILKLIGYSPVDFNKQQHPVIISEYAPNGSLDQIVNRERGKIPIKGWDDTQKLICLYGISSAMDFLHSNKVIHRDLKLLNIMIDEFLYPKIGDFGLAKVLHKNMDSMTFQSNSCVKGTAYCIAPEIIDIDDDEIIDDTTTSKDDDDEDWYNSFYSPASDVYSFAFIAYELITLKKPFEGMIAFKIYQKVCNRYRPPIDSTVPSVYKKMIEDCWSHSPAHRPSFAQISHELETNKKFITEKVDASRFHAYVKFIKESIKVYDKESIILDPMQFMKGENIKIRKVKIEDEIEKPKTAASRSSSRSKKIKIVLRKVKNSDSDSEPEAKEIFVSTQRKRKPIHSESAGDIKITLYPKAEYKALSQSCQNLVLRAETNAKEQFKVAKGLIHGSDEFPENKELGAIYLKESLSKGYIDPEGESIRWIVEGKVVPRDITNARKYLTENMEKSDPKYPILLGKIMIKEKKFNDAKKEFERAASIDNGEAQYELGKMYFKGQGVETNFDEAMKLFSKSQDNGCSKSSNFLKNHKEIKRAASSGKVIKPDSPIKIVRPVIPKKIVKKKTVKKDDINDRRKEAETIGDVDESQFKTLSSSFSSDPSSAIKDAESYLMKPYFTSYNDFLSDVKKSMKSNCCIVSWSKGMLHAKCLDCELHENSCICIPCFLAGKHDQHHSFVLAGSGAGNCDCGDPSFWKTSGNCPHHPGPDADPDLSQMTPINRKKFITVFKAAFCGGFNSKNEKKIISCFKWIQSFIEFGDGLRRCCSIAITSLSDEFFYTSIEQLDYEATKALIDLFGKLVSDHVFSTKMGSSLIKNYLSLRRKIQGFVCKETYFKKSKPFYPIKKLLGFSFHFFNEKPLMFLMKSGGFDWVDFIFNCFEFVFETVKKAKADYYRVMDGEIIEELWYMDKLIEVLLKDDSQHNKLQLFINRYSKLLEKYEASFYYSFMNKNDVDPNSNYVGVVYLVLINSIYSFNSYFSNNFEASAKNKTFSISETFGCLFNFLQSQKDFQAVSIYSDQKMVPISPILPLHHFFYCLLSSIKNPIEVIKKECAKKCVDLQDFCSLCSIYPLRFVCSLFIPNRFGHIEGHIYRIIDFAQKFPNRLFNHFFGLFQILLGIAPEKEQIMENAAKTLGLFTVSGVPAIDDIRTNLLEFIVNQIGKSQDIEKNAAFQSAIFLISALTDRSAITSDKLLFKRLRVIELMKRSKPSAKEIESFASDQINNPIFGDDLSCYAERVKTKSGSYFKLTDELEFTPFFPLILVEQRCKLLAQDEDKLVRIPENIETEANLSFQTCFRTPLFVTLMFNCLKNKDNKAEFQVGLAMFVLAMQNGPKFDSISYKANKKNLTVNGENLEAIFDKLKNMLDSDTINFATINFKLGDERAVTIIQLVESNTKIGYKAIEKADLPIKIKVPEVDEEELKRQKKEKARKLKEDLMKEYETRRNVFSLGGTSSMFKKDENEKDGDEDGEDDDLSFTASIRMSMTSSFMKEKPQCSVCKNPESENILCFPCLSIPSIFASIIHSSLHNLKTPIEDMDCIFSLSICTHAVHYKCCSEHGKGKTFKCMIDRGERNCLLPYFPLKKGKIFESKLSKERIEVIKKFMNEAFKIEKSDNQLLVALKSFAGAVSIVEVRQRSRPESIDSASVPFLLRNLLLTLYFYYNIVKTGAASDFKNVKDPLLKLVVNIMNSKNPKNDFKNFVNEIGKTLKGDFLHEFLRRAAVIEDLALKQLLFTSGEKYIDWDDIFSLESLLDRFDEIDPNLIKSKELPPFKMIPLADRFVGLYQDPYNMDIFDTSLPKFVDLLTGKVVFFLKNRTEKVKTDLPYVFDYVKEKYKNGLAMFLSITGPNASSLIYFCPELNKLFTQDSFYVDQFGDTDHGLTRGAILSLSQDRLDSSLDKLLSGEVLLY